MFGSAFLESHPFVTCFIATCLVFLIILLPSLLHWCRNQAQAAPIHGVVQCLAEWLSRVPLQVMSSKTWSRSPARTHRLTSLQGRTRHWWRSYRWCVWHHRTHWSRTVDFTTVHAGARRKCKSLRCHCSSASSSKRQPTAASSSLINLWQTSNVAVCGKLQGGHESSSHVERSLLRGESHREFGSASLSQHDWERILSKRKNLHEYLEKEAARALQGECTVQRRLSEAEVEMDRRETSQQFESQRLENQWADQSSREKNSLCRIGNEK